MNNSPTPLVLHNGIYLQSTQFDYGVHMDSAHLAYMNGGPGKPEHLGMLTPWITTGYRVPKGMHELTGYGKNRKFVRSHTFSWETPIPEKDCMVMADLCSTDEPGRGGVEVKVKFSKRFGNTDIITVDKYSQIAAYVTADEIVQDGDGWVHTLRVAGQNSLNKSLPKEWFRPGVRWYRLSSALGEYGQTYSELSNLSGGSRTFYQHVGSTARANTHYTITRDAAKGTIKKGCLVPLEEAKKVIEMYEFRPGSPAYDISLTGRNPVDAYTNMGMSRRDALTEMTRDIVQYAWVPLIEGLGLTQIDADIENMAMWSPGGTLQVEGHTSVELGVGLYYQLNNGHVITYNIPNMTIDKFELYITNRLQDRELPYQGREFTVFTGRGGLHNMKQLLRKLPSKNGAVVIANDFIKNKGGDDLHLGWSMEFDSWEFSFGKVTFKLLEALDPTAASEIENPLVNGYRLSSFMYIIEDLTSSGNNVWELVNEYDWDFNVRVIEGRLPYLDAPGGWGTKARSVANNGPGYEWYADKPHKAYWLEDATKSLIIKPINPFTGKAFGESHA